VILEYRGQSAAYVVVKPGEVAVLSGVWSYRGSDRTVTEKVYGQKVGTYFHEIRPPADPDSDATRNLDAIPARFLVTISL